MKKIVRLTESDLLRLVKRVIKEQSLSVNPPMSQKDATQPTQTSNPNYVAGGGRFCFFGTCRIDIKVIEKSTGKIITSRGLDGKDLNQLYPQVIKLVQDDLAAKNITGVVLPKLEEIPDSTKK